MRRLAAVVLVVAAALLLPPAAALGDLPEKATWTAVINDHPTESTTTRDPVRLVPGVPATVSVTIENRSAAPVSARYVRLQGTVLGLSFYVYTTRVDLEVPAGGNDRRVYPIDLLDLGRQASGLIPSRISLLNAAGDEIAGRDLMVDVRGDVSSVYGTFGIAVGLLTLVLLASALWQLATRGLHPNRWRRGLTLAAPGLGLGFLVTFTLSALRVLAPVASLWTSLLLAGAIIGFAAGYLSPTPFDGDAADRDLLGRHAAPPE